MSSLETENGQDWGVGNIVESLTIFQEPDRVCSSGWLGHIPFAFWVIEAAKPHVVVELGSHEGASFCAFCQQVAQSKLDTVCYAVDTWQGDGQAGYYDDTIYENLKKYVYSRYGAFAQLTRSTFDDAQSLFLDASIDLLHIDGFHSYDAMRHDFEMWLPKMSSKGVVLMHDINEVQKGFGGITIWSEICQKYQAFSFTHGHGLGVVVVGSNPPNEIKKFISNGKNEVFRSKVRHIFSYVGHQIESKYFESKQLKDSFTYSVSQLNTIIEIKNEEINRANNVIHQLNMVAQELSARSDMAVSKIHEFRNSKSWKVTAPLREGMNAFRRILGQAIFNDDTGSFVDSSLLGKFNLKNFDLYPSQRTKRRIKVVVIYGEDSASGSLLRIEQVKKALSKIFSVHAVCLADLDAALPVLDTTDIIWAIGVLWDEPLGRAVNKVLENKGKYIYDCQNNIACSISHGEMVHQPSIATFPPLRDAILRADLCIAPTKQLARHLAMLGKAVKVIPMGFDRDLHVKSLLAKKTWTTTRNDSHVRIGCAASQNTIQAHFEVVASALAEILSKYPEVMLTLFKDNNSLQEHPELMAVSSQIEWRTPVPVADLSLELARFDINIAPQEECNFLCEEVEFHFFEAALVEVPTVAAATGPYAEAIRPGETGLLATSTDEWIAALESLIISRDERERIAQNAYRSILWSFSEEKREALAANAIDFLLADARERARIFVLDQVDTPVLRMPHVSNYKIIFSEGHLGSRVSVVLPVYNLADSVVASLDFIAQQTSLDFDVIVIDDCSTDNSVDVVEAWMRQKGSIFNSVSLLQNDCHSKLATTKNSGIDYSRSEYIFIADGCITISPKCLELCINALDASGAAIAIPKFSTPLIHPNRLSSSGQWDPYCLRITSPIDTMAMIRKAHWVAVGGFEPRNIGCEDFDFLCKLIEHGFFGIHIAEICRSSRIHEGSMPHAEMQDEKKELLSSIRDYHPWLV